MPPSPPSGIAVSAPSVSFDAVHFSWPGADAPLLSDFSLQLEPGRVTAIVGPSGCGKSTLLRLAAGLLQPTSGVVSTGTAATGERAFVFQSPNLLPWRSVADNVALPLELGAPTDTLPTHKRVQQVLEQVELSGSEDLLPHQLSGGMQMRASLARALVTHPRLLLLDEPFSALDAATRRRVQQVFARAWTRAEATVVMVTHDIDEAVLLADRVVAVGGSPLRIRHTLPIPLPHPRTADLRHQPALGVLVQQVEAVL